MELFLRQIVRQSFSYNSVTQRPTLVFSWPDDDSWKEKQKERSYTICFLANDPDCSFRSRGFKRGREQGGNFSGATSGKRAVVTPPSPHKHHTP